MTTIKAYSVPATKSSSPLPPTQESIEQSVHDAHIEFAIPGNQGHFAVGPWRPATPEQVLERAQDGRPLSARLAGGNWGPIRNAHELSNILAVIRETPGVEPPAPEAVAAESGQRSLLASAVATHLPTLTQLVQQFKPGSMHPRIAPERVRRLEFLDVMRGNLDNPVNFFEEMHARHGQSFEVRLPMGKYIFDTRERVVNQALMQTDRGDHVWEKPPLQGHGLAFLLGSDNVFLGQGETWKKAHDIMAPYLNGRAMNSDQAGQQIDSILCEHLADLKKRVAASPNGELQVDVRSEMQKATLDVALRTLLDTHLQPAELEHTQAAFQTMMKWLTKESLNPTNVSLSQLEGLLPGAGALREAYDTLTALGDRIVAEHKDKPGNNTLVDALVHTKDPDFDDRRLRNEVLTIMLAGHETTATLLSWTTAEMARHPDQYAKVQAEVESLPRQSPSHNDLRQLGYVHDTIEETLRLYSPAYFLVRRATEDTKIGPPGLEMSVPKGTMLVMSTFHTHRNEADWGKAATGFPATEFHPERHEVKTASKAYPFGGGTRVCLGQNMARVEAQLMLARFAQDFDFAGFHHPDLAVASDVSVHPADARVTLKLRDPALAQGTIAKS